MMVSFDLCLSYFDVVQAYKTGNLPPLRKRNEPPRIPSMLSNSFVVQRHCHSRGHVDHQRLPLGRLLLCNMVNIGEEHINC